MTELDTSSVDVEKKKDMTVNDDNMKSFAGFYGTFSII